MPRVAGVDLPRDKRVEVALTHIYGVGPSTSREVLTTTGISPDTRVRDLTEQESAKLRDAIERNYTIEGDRRRDVQANVQRLIEIQCYRGLRHRRGLPVRGQRTRTNARTRKGKPKTVAGRKRALQKT